MINKNDLKHTTKKTKHKVNLPKWLNIILKSISVLFKTLAVFMIIGIITGCIVGTALTIYVMDAVNSEPIIDLKSLNLNYTSIVYGKDESGNDVEVQRLNSKENRVWVDYSDIPQDVIDAVVCVEDERFLTHTGVDFKRTFGAFINWFLKRDNYGGSTITQQLVKNINGDISRTSRTPAVKIQEIITAMNLEKNFTKEQILEAYLNYIALDNNINGIGAGAKYYFNKDVKDLTLEECAALSVISKNPSELNPYKNPERAKTRRQYAFDKMLEFGKITQQEYDEVYNKDLVLVDRTKVTEEGQVVKKVEYHNWYVDSLLNEVITDLANEYGYSREYASNLIHTGGYQIYSNMDIKRQQILEDYFKNPDNFKVKGVNYKTELPNAYMQIMDLNGRVVATVGGKGEKVGDRLANRVYTAPRPAGSTIKPLAVYTPAFEADIINWSTAMDDNPVQVIIDPKTNQERNWPNNYNFKYEGYMPIISAIQVSKNTIPVRLVNSLGPETCFDFVYNQLNMHSLVPTGPHNNINPASLALGDGGSTLAELTAAYQIFANGGTYREPKLYEKVLDGDGKVVLDTTSRKQSQVMSSETAYIMNKALWYVVNQAPGSGRGAALSNWETIGKTGTSNNQKDLLFMGMTPYYVAGIRYGYDDNSDIKVIGKDHKIVWKEVMELMHQGLEPAKFDLNKTNVHEYDYCTYSGLLAHEGCPTKRVGYYKTTNIPPTCTRHSFTGEVVAPIEYQVDEELVIEE